MSASGQKELEEWLSQLHPSPAPPLLALFSPLLTFFPQMVPEQWEYWALIA